VAPQAFVIDVTLAVKNGPVGMWRSLSDPAHIAPYGPLAWWVWPLAAALVAAGVAYGRRLLGARPAGTPRPSAGGRRVDADAPRREGEAGGRLIDLDARRRGRAAARRGRR
jgi:hypothetical protein